MNSFLISARKYRPQKFSQIKGQEHIITTLKNALKNNQLAQVFLFAGPKGSGKTTTARILGKAANCLSLTSLAEPCCTCENCLSLQKNQSLNVIEIDAASNNSVEDIRNIKEQIRYKISSGKTIFIIDEAHMLSNAAFHGLLKVLEEPPKHIIFIFATTQKHKVIDTILSRCQIFDFHYLTKEQIISQLEEIAKKEDISYEKKVLQLISHKAGGSLRDALSTFDLVTSFEQGKQLTYQGALRHLNLLDHTYYFKLTDALLEKKIGEALYLYEQIIDTGFRADHFITGFSEHLRNLLISKANPKVSLMNPTMSNQGSYVGQATGINISFLYKALAIVHQASLHYKNAQNKRLHIEIMLIQVAQINSSAKSSLHETTPRSHTKTPTINPTTNKSQSNTLTPKKTSSTVPKKNMATPVIKTPQQDTASPKPIRVQTPKQSNQPLSSLNPTTISQHWQAIAKSLENNDPAGFSIMHLPIKVQDNTIIIQLINPTQQDKVTRLKPHLDSYLSKKLGHKHFRIQTFLQKKEIKETIPQEHLLKELGKENPNVDLLQKTLDLVSV